MKPDDFRRIALGMAGAIESAHMDHPDFRANGRIFATLHPDGRHGMVKLTPEQQQEIIARCPAAFTPESGAWGRQGCTRVTLSAVDEETIGEALTLAHRNTTSKPSSRPSALAGRARPLFGGAGTGMTPTFFAGPADFRRWLKQHHARASELWVGFYKRGTGRPSITWPESVDEALCFGWIDAIRKSLGPDSYVIRFTPRKPRSVWSAVNTRRAQALTAEGRMRPDGLKAFAARDPKRSGIYSFEQRKRAELGAEREALFKKHKAAWAFFQSQPPGYRRLTTWWVISAKREETRAKRLAALIEDSAAGRRIAQLQRPSARQQP